MSHVFSLLFSLFTVGIIFVNAQNGLLPSYEVRDIRHLTRDDMLMICSTIVKRLKREEKDDSLAARLDVFNELIQPCIEMAATLTDHPKIPDGTNLTVTLLKKHPVFVNFFLAHIAEMCLHSENCISWLLQHLLYGSYKDDFELTNFKI